MNIYALALSFVAFLSFGIMCLFFIVSIIDGVRGSSEERQCHFLALLAMGVCIVFLTLAVLAWKGSFDPFHFFYLRTHVIVRV